MIEQENAINTILLKIDMDNFWSNLQLLETR